jgi:hypothetical protein
MAKDPGTVYLLHFDRPFGPGGGANGRGTARHYVGWAEAGRLAERLAEHGTPAGSVLMFHVAAAGIGWQLARTWPGDKNLERHLKQMGGASRRCPLCGVRPRTPVLGPRPGPVRVRKVSGSKRGLELAAARAVLAPWCWPGVAAAAGLPALALDPPY